jgi:type IV pilus biogenesis/stability protein PilW
MRRQEAQVTVFRHRLLMGSLAIILLTGCAGSQESRKRVSESEGHYKEGVSFLQTDQQRAFVALHKAIELNPENFEAHYTLGSIYFQRKELPEAEREFRKATDLNRNSGEAYNYLGRTLLLQGRWSEATEALKTATTLPLYPTPDIAFTDLGWVLEKQGDLDGAIAAYESALRTDPPNIPRPYVHLWIGRLYMKLRDIPKARGALSQAKALDPNGTVGAEASRLMQQLK